jgi:hypothetical protein
MSAQINEEKKRVIATEMIKIEAKTKADQES